MTPDKILSVDINNIIAIAKEAGERILEVYNNETISVEYKNDQSPLTLADKLSHSFIVSGLKRHYPYIPIISEEDNQPDYKARSGWECFWLVDPLDGTAEFIKRVPDFAVNISLIRQDVPFLGVIYAPVNNELFYASRNSGAYKINSEAKCVKLAVTSDKPKDKIVVVVTRSHKTQELQDYIERLKNIYKRVECISMGSSLKFCLMAEGRSNIFPNFGRTMEWDTAAGHIILEEAGGTLVTLKGCPLKYNKQSLINEGFFASSTKEICLIDNCNQEEF